LPGKDWLVMVLNCSDIESCSYTQPKVISIKFFLLRAAARLPRKGLKPLANSAYSRGKSDPFNLLLKSNGKTLLKAKTLKRIKQPSSKSEIKCSSVLVFCLF
jgi:hypothetical protein